jgi:hypothetical protein
MFTLKDEATNKVIGEINDEQFQFLVDELEEEGVDDTDYAISRLLMEIWVREGKHIELVDLFLKALGDRDEMNITWEKR